jgi:branched-subunit amino acid aminotransferase/4-amino-4-deoxychorismate lyase
MENDKRVELLEGLTSNLFIVYSDGTIRTPVGSVLDGYARKLVIEAAQRMGWMVVTNEPICLEDATKGCWKEVFFTSSIRLVVPVGKVLVPINSNNNDIQSFLPIWSANYLSNNNRQWYALYHNIINHIHK